MQGTAAPSPDRRHLLRFPGTASRRTLRRSQTPELPGHVLTPQAVASNVRGCLVEGGRGCRRCQVTWPRPGQCQEAHHPLVELVEGCGKVGGGGTLAAGVVGAL